jgi:hypothetical protein
MKKLSPEELNLLIREVSVIIADYNTYSIDGQVDMDTCVDVIAATIKNW